MAGICFGWLFVMLLCFNFIRLIELRERELYVQIAVLTGLLLVTPLAALVLALSMVRRWRTGDVA